MEHDVAVTAEETSKSKALTEFVEKVRAIASEATLKDREYAAAISKTGRAPSVETITPVVAAWIYTNHNKVNRDFTISKSLGYVEVMKRGDWRKHHQGIAFYPDGTLADGQHRMAAVALSNIATTFLVFNDFDKDAIDGIDRTKGRTAGEALAMVGISDAKIKATVAKIVMGYEYEHEHGRSRTFDDPLIERWVIEQDALLTKAVAIGRKSVQNVSDPAMTEARASQVAMLMLRGGADANLAQGYIASVQQGIATYPQAPTLELGKKLMKARISEHNKDKLSTKESLALSMKAAQLWVDGKSTNKLVWLATKEALPDYHIARVELQTAAE